METVGDFMEDWLKKWKQELSWQERWDVNGWHKEDDLSEELDDYWGQDDEEEADQQPKKHIRRAARNRIIREAIEKNKVYNIDRLFWNGGKLFGYDTYYETLLGCIGDCDEKIGPFIKVMRNGEEYEILLKFDWERCFLSLTCKSFNPYIIEPVYAKVTVLFEQLFGVKDVVVKTLIDTEIEKLINTIERLRNDGKKDNRNS